MEKVGILVQGHRGQDHSPHPMCLNGLAARLRPPRCRANLSVDQHIREADWDMELWAVSAPSSCQKQAHWIV